VENNIFLAPNLIVKCSTSGKLTKSLVHQFLDEAVKPNAQGDVLYILDKWPCQTDESLYSSRFQNEDVNMTVKFIPENTTDLVQPLDTYFHRQLKLLVRKFYEYEMLYEREDRSTLVTRNGILKLQSLVHFLLKAPIFNSMIRQCWYSSGLFVGDKPEFSNVNSICFQLGKGKCEVENCTKKAFIRRSWCMKCVCYDEFYHDYHLILCKSSPYLI
jgi:DDE superfamily endonuclease/Tc5 transposase-like protein